MAESKQGLDRVFSMEIARVTEAAAIESAKTMGQGDRKHSDHVAVEAIGPDVRAVHRVDPRAVGVPTLVVAIEGDRLAYQLSTGGDEE